MRLPPPDGSQMRALGRKLSTKERVSGIHGPPGTGKSIIGAYLAVLKAAEGERVLCVSYQNEAIDQLSSYITSLIFQAGPSLGLNSPHECFCRVGYKPKVGIDLMPYYCSYQESEEKKIVTTTTYSSRHLQQITQHFQTVIIEEGGQIPFHQAWIALENLSLHDRSVVVTGDDKQIFPSGPGFVKEQSILSNLRRINPNHIDMLETTYRLPDPGRQMTSSIFYGNRLNAPASVRNRRLEGCLIHADGPYGQALTPENSLFYMGVIDDNEEWRGGSWVNRAQAGVALKLSRFLLEGGYPPSRISLVAPYRAQRYYVNQELRDHGFSLRCTTVHGMQGKENDVVIFMTTRSNDDQYFGVLRSQPEMLNVATSRHRRKLIVIGDSREVFSDGSRASKAMFNFMNDLGLVGWVSPPASYGF